MTSKKYYSIAIHGGAGAMSKGKLSIEQEADILDTLKNIVISAQEQLANGDDAIDVVQVAVNKLEACPWFNAGKGAVFNHEGKHELDASIMCGKTLDAGAVSGIRYSPSPIDVARAVMDKSEHVYLGGIGAEQFAKEQNLPQVENTWFDTEMRYQQLLNALKLGTMKLEPEESDYKFGTVGAVALDLSGNVASATSTGGITNKKYGRVGDTPVIGAGTYANNNSAAISATGHGEHFLRHVVAYNIASRMTLAGKNLKDATYDVVHGDLMSTGGSGGVIAVDARGNIELQFNTEGMYRGWGSDTISAESRIYED